jgi:hypothetical protein
MLRPAIGAPPDDILDDGVSAFPPRISVHVGAHRLDHSLEVARVVHSDETCGLCCDVNLVDAAVILR